MTASLAGVFLISTQAQSADHAIFLPLFFLPGVEDICQSNSEEQELADYLINDPYQHRLSLHCNTILSKVARERAQDMAHRDYFSHINPDGFGPNYLVEQAGYLLPSFYSQEDTGNNIESIGAGSPTAGDVWTLWMNSEGHRVHLLGLEPFYAEQIEYGIGYAYSENSQFGHYWVIITARK